jgi:hypothetical protein
VRTGSSGSSTRLARPRNRHNDATHEYSLSTMPSLQLCSIYCTHITAVTPSMQPSELMRAPLSLVVSESARCGTKSSDAAQVSWLHTHRLRSRPGRTR